MYLLVPEHVAIEYGFECCFSKIDVCVHACVCVCVWVWVWVCVDLDMKIAAQSLSKSSKLSFEKSCARECMCVCERVHCMQTSKILLTCYLLKRSLLKA